MKKYSMSTLIPVDIIIDSNEKSQNIEIYNYLVEKGLRVSVRDIDVGDYIIPSPEGREIVVERKTIDDFANSIIDGRVWRQARKLVEYTQEIDGVPVIIIEGNLQKISYRGISITAVMRALDAIAIDYNIRVMPSIDRLSTAKWLVARAKASGKRENKEKRWIQVPSKKKPLTVDEKILTSLALLVGKETAIKLLTKFGTLKEITGLSIHQLKTVEGIGEERARRIFLLFNRKVLVKNREGAGEKTH